MNKANTTPALDTFEFIPGINLRVIRKDGEPWFVAKDVCGALGFNHDKDGTAAYLRDLAADERGTVNMNTLNSNQGKRRGNPNVNIINESGLYSLILKSRKPEAQRFKKWVTSVVLPAIRKDGAYVVGEEKVATGEMSEDELILKAMTALQAKLDRAQARLVGLDVVGTRRITVREFCLERGINLPQGKRVQLGLLARSMGDLAGRTPEYKVQLLATANGLVEAGRSLFPVEALDRALVIILAP